MPRHKQGHLGTPGWPVTAKVKAVNPYLTLEGEKTKETKPSNWETLTALSSEEPLVSTQHHLQQDMYIKVALRSGLAKHPAGRGKEK